MKRVLTLWVAGCMLGGCGPWIGSCPDDVTPEPLESGVFEAFPSDVGEQADALLGGAAGPITLTVDRASAEVHLDYQTADGELRSLTYTITDVVEQF